MRKPIFLLVGLLASFPLMATAKGTPEQAIKEALAPILPAGPESIRPTQIKGLYEVSVGTQIVYVSADGRYVLQGDLIDLKKQENVTESRRAESRKGALKAVDKDSMITYSPKGKVKHRIMVFTDIDCPYCRKLHKEVGKLNELGIEVDYLAFPRAGLGSPSYDKAVSVWCADDRQKAMNDAKNKGIIKPKTCDNPVKAQMELGDRIGVRGTPAIFLEDGTMLPGYMPAERLANMLDKKDK
jgi:thiol:disulfide interchange protein DsbC